MERTNTPSLLEGSEEGLKAEPKQPPAESTPPDQGGVKKLSPQREWQIKNRVRHLETRRRWNLRNREKLSAYDRSRRQANPEKHREKRRLEYIRRRDKYLEYSRLYTSTPEFKSRPKKPQTDEQKKWHKEYNKRYYSENRERNRDRHNAARNQARKLNPELHREYYRRWRKKYPDRYRAQHRAAGVKRRVRLRGADVGCPHVNSLIRRWRMQKSFRCYWCNRCFGIRSLHIDHIIPVSKNGKHAAANICRSCPDCNVKKKDKLQTDPTYRGQMLLC